MHSLRLIALLLAGLTVAAGQLLGAESFRISPAPLQNNSGGNGVDVAQDLDDSIPAASGEKDDSGKSEFVVAPLPSHNPALGWTLGLPAMRLYHPKSQDEDDAAWITGVGGFYAENKSWGGGAFHRMGLQDDVWLLKFAGFYGDVRFDYYGIGQGGASPVSVPLRQKMQIYLAEVLHQLRPNLHVGIAAKVANNQLSIDGTIGELPGFVPDLSSEFSTNDLAARLKYDSRDVEFYPTTGWLIDGTSAFGRDALGSSSEYELHEINFNTYRAIGDRGVVAARLAFEYAAGDSPFFLYPAFGSGVDLRGYQTGTYRDRSLIAAQIEYRHRVTKRIGAVAFAGVGSVSPDFLGWSETLPSVGLGVRWVIAPQNNMSLRVDYAWGDGDSQFYVGLGEAF